MNRKLFYLIPIVLIGIVWLSQEKEYMGWIYPNGINSQSWNFEAMGTFDSWDSCELAGWETISQLNHQKNPEEVQASFECAVDCTPYGELYQCGESRAFNED